MKPGRGGELPTVTRHEVPAESVDGETAMGRRHALKVMAIAAAAPGLVGCDTAANDGVNPESGGVSGRAAGLAPSSNPLARGTSTDPDLLNPTVPWQRVLTDDELETVAALCDVILPDDDVSPSASTLGVHEFIDEWVSAPYSRNERDRVLIRGGLVWLDNESRRRFEGASRFRTLSDEQMRAICDDICHEPEAAEAFRSASRFFARVRDLAATGFYTTDEGMADIGYVGNQPSRTWGPPPVEVLRRAGLPTSAEA